MKDRKNDPKSLAKLLSAMLIFGSIGLFRRLLPLPSALIAFARGVTGALFLAAVMALRRRTGALRLNKKAAARYVLSGALIGINWMLLFEAFEFTSVPKATLAYYLAPTFVILLAAVFLGERLTLKRTVSAGASLFGMVLVSGVLEGEGLSPDDLKGIIFGCAAAVIYAAVVLINKKSPDGDPYKKTTVQLAAAAAVMLPYLVFTGGFAIGDWSISAALILLLVGVLHTGAAYALYFGSMSGLRTDTIAIMSYLDPITALVLSAVFLGEKLTAPGIAGAALIIGSALFCELGGKNDKD